MYDYIKEIEETLEKIRKYRKKTYEELRRLPSGQLHVWERDGKPQYVNIIADPTAKKGVRRAYIGEDPELVGQMREKEKLAITNKLLKDDEGVLAEALSNLTGASPEVVDAKLRYGVEKVPLDLYMTQTDSGLFVPHPTEDRHIQIQGPALTTGGLSAEAWAREPYRVNTSYKEEKIHRGVNGIMFRRRGEMLVANCYDNREIGYHYDELRNFFGEWLSPDFIGADKFLNLKYHEHCGLFGDDGYDASIFRKLPLYARAGIYPGRNLIITCDEPDGGIDTRKIDRLLEIFYAA